MKTNIYEEITNKVVAMMEKGVAPWKMPWSCTADAGMGMMSYSTGKPYSFLNQMLLFSQGGGVGEYVTFKQVQQAGGQINKGAKSMMVTFFTKAEFTTKDKDGKEKIETYPMLRYYNVFQLSDTNLKPKHSVPTDTKFEHNGIKEADKVAQEYVIREGIQLVLDHTSNEAFYSPKRDRVVVPMISQFQEESEYYSTLYHELTHSTGTSARCDRKLDTKIAAFGGNDYSREELVAEMGSAMSLARFGIEVQSTFENSVAYLKSWAEHLKKDPKAIVWAANRAEKAVKYIFGELTHEDIEKAAESK